MGIGRLSRRTVWIGGIAAVLLLLVGGFAGTLVWALHDLPPGTSLAGSAEPSVIFETADGKPLARKGPFKAADMSLAEFPDALVDAVISIEDRRFYSHSGLDFRGIVRAFARNVSAGEVVQGGSTINQQLVKILHLERDRTLKRKIREAAIAVWLDMRLGKDEILTRYLNNVYLGAGATGVPAAARIYFDKSPADLTLAESALLAGLIKAPSQLNPLKDLDAARGRAAIVLDAMVAAGRLDADAAKAAKENPATLAPSRIDAHTGTWFADWVAKEAAEITGSFRGTMRVRTTLDPRAAGGRRSRRFRSARRCGRGARRFAGSARRACGRTARCSPWWAARTTRRASSTGPSTPCASPARPSSSSSTTRRCATASRRATGSRTLRSRSRAGSRRISARSYHGRVSLAEAFARSLNTATVRLAMEVGIDEVIAAARDLGIDAPLSESPSLALGSSEVSLLDLTGAYASVRAGVAPVEPWGIAAFGTDEQARMFKLGPPVAPERELAALPGAARRPAEAGRRPGNGAGRRARRLCGRKDRHEPELSRRLVHRLQRGARRRRVGRQRRRDADGRGDRRQAAGAHLAEFHDRGDGDRRRATAGAREARKRPRASKSPPRRRRACNATTAPAPEPTAPSARRIARSSRIAGSGSFARSDFETFARYSVANTVGFPSPNAKTSIGPSCSPGMPGTPVGIPGMAMPFTPSGRSVINRLMLSAETWPSTT